jgi:hypothetical protein
VTGTDLFDVAKIHNQVRDPDVAHLAIGLNQVVSSNGVEGLAVETEEVADGVHIDITVAEGAVIAKPVHMCFGLLQEEGIQKITMRLTVEPQSRIAVTAHCVFPNAEDVRHLMDAVIRVGEGAEYTYFERHIHSPQGGITVVPKARIHLARGARFKTDFELIEGRVGSIDVDYEAECDADARMEMNAAVSGKADDRIKIREIGHLNGERARGVLTSRVAVRDEASAEIYNELTASAAGAVGHVDCKEIVQGRATANAVPVVQVSHPKAHITHEAALGSVDSRQLETLMARGLTEDEATEVIINGLLRST